MAVVGNGPPARDSAKGAYLLKDFERLRDFYGVPLKPPSNFENTMFVKG